MSSPSNALDIPTPAVVVTLRQIPAIVVGNATHGAVCEVTPPRPPLEGTIFIEAIGTR